MVQGGLALSTGKAGRMQTLPAKLMPAEVEAGCWSSACFPTQGFFFWLVKPSCLSPAEEALSTQALSHFHSSSTTLSSWCRTVFGSFFPSLLLQNKEKEEWRGLVYEGTGHKMMRQEDPCHSTPQPPKKLTDSFHLSARSKPKIPSFSFLCKTSPRTKQKLSIASQMW